MHGEYRLFVQNDNKLTIPPLFINFNDIVCKTSLCDIVTLFSEFNNSPQTIFQSTYMQIMLKKGTMEFFPKCFTEFAEF